MVNSRNDEDYLSKSPLNNLQKPLQDLLREHNTTGLYHFHMKNNKKLLYNNHKSTKIPKIIHFILSLEVFGIVQFLSVASAYIIHKNYLIYVHCSNIPTGFYWDMVSSVVVINIIRDKSSIINYVNEADITRLRVLLRYGGVYMDLDVISLVPFDHLLDNNFVMGREKSGLFNGVIMSTKTSKFLKIWYNARKKVTSSDPNFYTSKLPDVLLKNSMNNKDITILKERSFLRPLQDEESLKYDVNGYLAVHLWNTVARPSVA
jgi:hypothetical protein